MTITLFCSLFILFGFSATHIFKKFQYIDLFSMALALGTIQVLVFFELIPEILETTKWYFSLPFIAFVIFVLSQLDAFLPEHHSHAPGEAIHIGLIGALAISLHNIVEGMVLYGLAQNNFQEALFMAIGVGLHNIPMGMMIASSLKQSKSTIKYTMMALSVFSTLVGGMLMMSISVLLNTTFMTVLLCIACGMLIYIAYFELFDALLMNYDKKEVLSGLVIGMAIMVLSLFIA